MFHRGEKLGSDRLILHNIRLVASETLRYFKGRTTDDTQIVSVISEGVFGLIRAIERFDPARGFRFSTYATHWIRRFIYRGSNQLRFIRLPHYIHGILARINRVESILIDNLGREPTEDEMADKLGQRVGAFRLAVQASSNTNILRPTSPSGAADVGSDICLDACNECTKSVNPVEALLAVEARDMLKEALGKINPRLATVVKMRFGIDCKQKHTLQEIGVILNLSRERIRQLEAEGKKHLKLRLIESGGADL